MIERTEEALVSPPGARLITIGSLRFMMLASGEIAFQDDVGAWQPVSKRVALSEVLGDSVSTVFLGMDHRFGRDGPPLIYETMVFGGPLDQLQERYATHAEAEAGHAAVCAEVRLAHRFWPRVKRSCRAAWFAFTRS